MMGKAHWYDGKTPQELDHTHVCVTLKSGSRVYGDLKVADKHRVGIILNSPWWGITVFEVDKDGTHMMEGVTCVDRLWDGKIWRRRTENDSGNPDAIYVNNRLYAVDSEEYDEDNNTFYEIVKKRSSSGAMLRMRFPAQAVTDRLMLVGGHPTESGIYKGADGSLWCITRRHEYWSIIRPDYIVWDRERGDIPAEAYPLHRVSDL